MNGKGITVVTTAGPLRASAIGNALSLVGVVTDAAMLNISPGVVDGSVLATALSEGGSFSFVVPGTYTLTSQQSIPSDCTINVGPGVILDVTSMSVPCFTATSKSRIRLTGDGIIRCVAASVPSFTSVDGLEVSVRIEDASGNRMAHIATGSWIRIPSIWRLRLTGSGNCTIDARDAEGNITTSVESYTASSATDQIEFPYAGDDAVEVRFTLTGTCKAEIL